MPIDMLAILPVILLVFVLFPFSSFFFRLFCVGPALDRCTFHSARKKCISDAGAAAVVPPHQQAHQYLSLSLCIFTCRQAA